MLLGVTYHESSDKERKRLLREVNDVRPIPLPSKKVRDRLTKELAKDDEIRICCPSVRYQVHAG